MQALRAFGVLAGVTMENSTGDVGVWVVPEAHCCLRDTWFRRDACLLQCTSLQHSDNGKAPR